MTVLEARRLQVGQGVVYGGKLEGIVVEIHMDRLKIQWDDGDKGTRTWIDHDQMQAIEKAKEKQPGRYDEIIKKMIRGGK